MTPADTIRDKAREVFERSKYNQPQWALPQWLVDAWKAFTGYLGTVAPVGSALYVVLVAGCVVALFAIVALMVYQLRAAFMTEASRRLEKLRLDRTRAIRSRQFAVDAEARAAAGDYTEAIRCLFLALVYRFDESGQVLFQTSWTNREYLTLFRNRPAVLGGLRLFVDTLDEFWYGQRPAGVERYRDCAGRYAELAR